MSFKPTAVPANKRHIAAKPSLSFEFQALASQQPTLEIGEVGLVNNESGIAIGELSLEQVGVSVLGDAPAHLIAMVRDQLESDAQVVVTLNVVDEDDADVEAVATFAPSAWANDQSFNFPEGFAVDLVVPGGKKVKEITSIESVVGGKEGGRILLLKLPALDTFKLVGCTTAEDFTTPARQAVSIACGSNPSKYVKRGRGEEATLSVTSKHVSYGDGLGRLNGRSSTVMLLNTKEGVLVERLFFGNWVSKVSPSIGDGNDEATNASEGMYEYFACLVAG